MKDVVVSILFIKGIPEGGWTDESSVLFKRVGPTFGPVFV